MFSSIIMDKMPACVYCTEIEACLRLVCNFFDFFSFLPFSSQNAYRFP